MAQILADALAPEGVNEQILGAAGVRLGHEEGSPPGQVGVFGMDELFVAISVLEEVDLNERVGARQLQLLVHLFAQVGQLVEQGQVLVYLEIGKEEELRLPERAL